MVEVRGLMSVRSSFKMKLEFRPHHQLSRECLMSALRGHFPILPVSYQQAALSTVQHIQTQNSKTQYWTIMPCLLASSA